ncbi:MAG TPA: acyl-[acyl-carrier-protein]--UDP-N-acetylglucosamine O-acyltransferase [Lentisphaeria bacterium]|nr:acyl-[acyl-carrier-protein]--UDP-N-acetylglucosamine O-acyltransferase [Lentisphaeria bacterium]
MTHIHPTAVIEDGARIGEGCTIGPYCTIGPHVEIGGGCTLHSHVVLSGYLRLGKDCEIFPFACLGMQTQDLKFEGDITYATIGDRTVIREYVTVNAATTAGASTIVGSDCLIQSYCHIAHECNIGNHVIMSSAAMLAGHVTLEDYAIIGGHTGIVQFVRVGQHAFVGGYTKLAGDVLPFSIVEGVPAATRGINKVGLKRRDFSPEQIDAIAEAHQLIMTSPTVAGGNKAALAAHPENADIAAMAAFSKGSKCPLVRRTKSD